MTTKDAAVIAEDIQESAADAAQAVNLYAAEIERLRGELVARSKVAFEPTKGIAAAIQTLANDLSNRPSWEKIPSAHAVIDEARKLGWLDNPAEPKPGPCPFPSCKSADTHVSDGGWNGSVYVVCDACRAEGPMCKTNAEAIAAWRVGGSLE